MQRVGNKSWCNTKSSCLYKTYIWAGANQWRTGGGGVSGVQTPPEILKALQRIMPNSTQFWKLLKKIAEFRMPTHQAVRKKKAVKF
jgi:hypothetical protein